MLRISIFILCLLCGSSSAWGQQPAEFIPNDPRYDDVWARQLNLPKAWAEMQRIEQTTGPRMSQAVVAVLDEWVDCNHPDLVANCLPQHTFNATDRPYQNSELHGTSTASVLAAGTNNGVGPSSVAGFLGRVKFISVKVCEGNLCKPEWVQAGLQRVLELKRSGIPVVVVACNFISGVTDPAGMDHLLRDLDSEQIDIIAPGQNDLINIDDFTAFPISYARTYDNITGITGLLMDGETLSSGVAFGPKTISLVSRSENIKVVSLLDPQNGSASFSGNSSVTPQVAGALALVRVYKEPNSIKARYRLKFSARMFPTLERKIKASPGHTEDAGRMAGRIDIYDALTITIGCPPPTNAILWVTKRDTNKLVALESVSMTQGPFSLNSPQNLFAADKQTRLMLFAYNLGQDHSALTVQAQDSAGTAAQLVIEYVGPVTNPLELNCLSQIVLRLPQLAAGDVLLTLNQQGQISGQGSIIVR